MSFQIVRMLLIIVKMIKNQAFTTYELSYQNTYDIKTDEVEEMPPIDNEQSKLNSLLNDLSNAEEEACESCSI